MEATDNQSKQIAITIITGFLGAGKTTLLLNLLPQLPSTYRVALLKNEFGDVAVDSQLLMAVGNGNQQQQQQQNRTGPAIAGVREMLNGCICCNLVGSLQDALTDLRRDYSPDRIIIETSGSAFPATLAMEVNRIVRHEQQQTQEQDGKSAAPQWILDGVVCVLDVENWRGYQDTSVTARLQAQYTDLLVLNKWELVTEAALEACIDRIGDLELNVPIPYVKSYRGRVDANLLLGLDARLARLDADDDHMSKHKHDHQHSEEVEILRVTLAAKKGDDATVDVDKLHSFLNKTTKDEVYRIKGHVFSSSPSCSSNGTTVQAFSQGVPQWYILNWAFGRWEYTPTDSAQPHSLLQLTIVTAKDVANRLQKHLESSQYFSTQDVVHQDSLHIQRIT